MKKFKLLTTTLLVSSLLTMSPLIAKASSLQSSSMNLSTTDIAPNTSQIVLSNENEVINYAKANNIPLENDGMKIDQIILNTPQNTTTDYFQPELSEIETKLADSCTILYPYEGYNTNRIAWSTSGTGPGTLTNTISKTTSSEIFGEFSGKTSIVEAKVGFKIGESTTCTSSYSVKLASGERKRIVGYFRYKGYFVKYSTLFGSKVHEVGRPIGIDFITYKQ